MMVLLLQKYLFVSFCFLSTTSGLKYVTIDTDLGHIRGIIKEARNGDKYNAFLGIPYAKPPLDELRWEPPQPTEGWGKGVLDATNHAKPCFHDYQSGPDKVLGSEDCLYVNVFTKNKSKDGEKKHTLFYIHGGAFIFGSIGIYGADYIMEQDDVILVTVQYRLNAFGFMSTEDAELPGNYGSLDQVEALRWVRRNIQSFGGDPEEVTIVGMSAGGASVIYLMLSPLTKDLYKNSVALSGSPLCWWANIPNPKKQAIKLAEHFNCPSDGSSKEMVRCMKQIHGDKLMAAQKLLFFDWHHNLTEREPMNMFSPRSDPERSDSFIPAEPYIMLKNGDMNPTPLMMGYADKEGIWRANQLLPDGGSNRQVWADFLADYNKLASLAFGLMEGQTADPEVMTKQVLKFYGIDNKLDMREALLTDGKVHNFIDALSDTMFTYGIDAMAKLRAKHKNNMDTYLYMLTFPGEMTLANLDNHGSYRRAPLQPLHLASHGTDMLLLFPLFPDHPPMPEKDIEVSRKFIRLIIDFGKLDSAPVKGWKPLDLDKPTYLLLDKEFSTQKGLPMQSRMQFWDSLPPVYWRFQNRVTKKHQKDEF